jgi:manganese oxidase
MRRQLVLFALTLVMLAVCGPLCFGAKTRNYYIAAEDVAWDYAPSGHDMVHGRALPQPWRQQTRWSKSRYIEYTDDTFSVRKPQPEWLGILGPVIRAEVGDTVVVHFLNRTRQPHSMHPHGLRYDKASEGAHYIPMGQGGSVPTNGKYTYTWFADKGSGPAKGESNSKVWWYHSHVEAEQEINAGLIGPIIVTAAGKANADGGPKDADCEFVVLFMIFDELNGKEAGLFHSINGYIFGNLPGLTMKQGERVRWYLLGMGNERDIHSAHWHGKTVQEANRHTTDVVELLPGSMVTVDMRADNPGTWLMHCHVLDHMEAGMMATYTIYKPEHPSCPVQFVSADFWNTPDKFMVNVKNAGPKTIKNLEVTFDHLVTAQYRRRPYLNKWTWNAQIQSQREQTFDMPGYPSAMQGTIQGWILFPEKIVYEDGSTWERRNDACFDVFWRGPEHPEMPVLPPLQIEMSED